MDYLHRIGRIFERTSAAALGHQRPARQQSLFRINGHASAADAYKNGLYSRFRAVSRRRCRSRTLRPSCAGPPLAAAVKAGAKRSPKGCLYGEDEHPRIELEKMAGAVTVHFLLNGKGV
jgi:hypothetical protein